MRSLPAVRPGDPADQAVARWPGSLEDLRFRALLGTEAWSRLPEAVRRRFAKRIDAGRAAVYSGVVLETRFSFLGRLLAQAVRPLGAPLPTGDGSGLPASVTVTEDGAAGGQVWTRVYGRRRGFPQVIHSAKRFRGPTGLEEHLGNRLGVALTVHAESEAIVFRSDHFFMQLGRRRLRLPAWLSPGNLEVSHIDRGAGTFDFVLALRHGLFGDLIRQTVRFADLHPGRPDS